MKENFWDWWIENQGLPPGKPKPEDADLAAAVRRLVGDNAERQERERDAEQ